MSKVAVVYWSGTGNTAAMADAVAKGATNAGAEVTCADTSTFDSSKLSEYSGVALGCPAMGAEQLDDAEFEPFYESIKGSLGGKKVGLFGSYGWFSYTTSLLIIIQSLSIIISINNDQ